MIYPVYIVQYSKTSDKTGKFEQFYLHLRLDSACNQRKLDLRIDSSYSTETKI